MSNSQQSQDDSLNEIKAKIKELENADNKPEERVADSQEFIILNEKYVRLMAEFDNFKRRTRDEFLLQKAEWAINVLKIVIGFFDNFQRAVEHCPDNIKESEWWKWIMAIESSFIQELEKKWLKNFKADGLRFDTSRMEAIMQDPNVEKGIVSKTIESWYEFNGNLVRPAKVVVWSKVA